MTRASGKRVIPLIEAERVASSRAETVVSYSLLALLLVIAGGVFARQFFFSPALRELHALGADAVQVPAPTSGAPGYLGFPLAADLVFMGERELFTPDTLYNKIDGKAELYLAAGIDGMECRRISLAADPDGWMEAFLFDMHSMRSAFSVYSIQRRAGARDLDLARFAYATENALFLVHGEYYLEIVAAVASTEMTAAMQEVARLVMAAAPRRESDMPEVDLLPEESLTPGSLALQTSDAFGFAGLSNVFTGEYRIDGQTATAFVTMQPDAAAAAEMAGAYRGFLLELGGRELPLSSSLGPGYMVEIMDSFEIVFAAGEVVAGVHAAESRAAAERLGAVLRERIGGRAP